MTAGNRLPLSAATLSLVMAAVCALVGCQTRNMMARSMPSEYRAMPGEGMQRLRLGGFATAHATSKAIGTDDLLTIQVATGLAGEEPRETQARVDSEGAVEAPLIGRVAVAGLEPAQAAEQIAAAAMARQIYVRPQVSVAVTEQATHRVTVLGAVSEPGQKELPREGCDLFSALAAAGGLTDEAGAQVELLRNGQLMLADSNEPEAEQGVKQVGFESVLNSSTARPSAEVIDLAKPDATSPESLKLGDRDVIIVRPKQERVIHVTGLVKTPDQFELMQEHDVRVLDAIAMAGGPTTSVADKVIVVRQTPELDEPLVIQVSISRAKTDGSENLILKSGDLVSVESTPATVALDTFKSLFRITMGVGGNLSLF